MKITKSTLALSAAVLAGLPLALGAATTARAATVPGASYVIPSGTVSTQAATPGANPDTVTLPYFTGIGPDNGVVHYIVTESSDAAEASHLGVNHAPKLANALGTAAVQKVTVGALGGAVHFAGNVDFSPYDNVTAGPAPNAYPPTKASAGAVGNAAYSPFVTTGNGIVRNSPILENSTGRADSIVKEDLKAGTVTLALTRGFYENQRVLYLRTESSDQTVAAIEDSTWAPNLASAPGLGSDDPATSAREGIVPISNGQTNQSGGYGNQARQGLNSTVLGEGAPLNNLQEEPQDPNVEGTTPSRYSPLWDLSIGTWASSIPLDQRPLVQSVDTIRELAGEGKLLTNGTNPVNPTLGLRPSGAVSVCPVIVVFASGS